MSWSDFKFLLFNEDFFLLLSIFCLINIFVFLTFYKEIINIFDPLNLLLINISSCITILIYLNLYKLIKLKYFYQLILIDLAFLISLKVILMIKNDIYILKKIKNKKFFDLYYKIHTLFFFIIVILFFKKIGMSLLYNKIEGFNSYPFIKLFTRYLIPGQTSLILIKRELYLIRSKKDFVILFLGLITLSLMGSKIAVLYYIINIYMILYLISEIKNIKIYKFLKKISILFLIGIFFIVLLFFGIVNKTDNFLEVLKEFILRIFSSGDIFYMVYVNENVDKMMGISLYDYYIYNLIGPILRRIIEVPEKIYPGFQIIEIIYGIKTQSFGPNTRFEYVWQSNMGYLGVFGGIIIGIIYALIRRIRSRNFILMQIITILLVNLEGLTSDFGLISGIILSTGITITIILIITQIIYYYILLNGREK